MRRTSILFWLGIVCCLNFGCAGFSEYRREQSDRRCEELNSDWVDSIWQAGYGFNNPNPDRARAGLEPVNFDGSVDEEEGFLDSMISNFIGDALGYGIESAFTAVGNAITR